MSDSKMWVNEFKRSHTDRRWHRAIARFKSQVLAESSGEHVRVMLGYFATRAVLINVKKKARK